MSPQNQPKQTKAERIAAAREKARQIREAEAKRRKRNSWLVRGSVIAAALAIVAIIASVAIVTIRSNAPIADSGPVPANTNVYGGVTFGKDGQIVPPQRTAQSVDKSTLGPVPTTQMPQPTDLPAIGIQASAAGQPVQVVVYVDFICPACNSFEQANASVLKQLADDGKITYEYRLSGLLDQMSTTNYSSRAAAAAACVVDVAPESYSKFISTLFTNQPPENGPGLSNDQLKKYARESGANIDSCVDDRTYRPMVQYTTQQALAHGISSTPTIFVDGQRYTSQAQGFSDFRNFLQGIIDAKKA